MSFSRRVALQPFPDRGLKSYVYDDEVKGLAVRVTSTGHKSYVVRFLNSETRKHEYVKLGDFSAFDIRKARELARIQLGTLQTTMALGLDPKRERQKTASKKITLQQALDRYIAERSDKKMQKHLSEAAQRDYRSCIQRHLKKYLNLPISELTKQEFLRIYQRIGEVKPATALKLGRYTRAVLNYTNLENDGSLFDKNPVTSALSGRLYGSVRKQTFVQFERMKEFFTAAERLDVDDHDFIYIALFSGLRAGAIRTLKWENVDLANKVMYVFEAEMHEGTSALPICGRLVQLFEARKARIDSDEWVFPGRDGGHLVEHKKIFDRLHFTAERQIDGGDSGEQKLITAHDLRRTFATVGAAIGLGESIIGDLLLHKKSNNVTAGYIIRQMQFLQTCVGQIEAEILRLSVT